MNLLPIVFTCDDNYFKNANVVICSLINNCNKKIKYKIKILSEFISDDNKKKAHDLIKNHSNFSNKKQHLKIDKPEK